MKKIENFKINVISDKDMTTLKGGDCNGTVSDHYHQCSFFQESYMDWNDEGCC